MDIAKVSTATFVGRRYIKQKPYIDDTGLWIPCEEYVPEGTETAYRMVISKEQFVEMYNKWIKGEENE